MSKRKAWLTMTLVIHAVLTSEVALSKEEETKYEDIGKPLATLLDEGWAVISQSESIGWDVHEYTTGARGVVAAVPLEKRYYYTFVLSKQGKWVMCFLTNPTSGNATSSCRRIN